MVDKEYMKNLEIDETNFKAIIGDFGLAKTLEDGMYTNSF